MNIKLSYFKSFKEKALKIKTSISVFSTGISGSKILTICVQYNY